MGNYKIAIVNSNSFGRRFKNLYQSLEEIGEVARINIDPNINGRELAETLYGYNIIIASVAPYFGKEFFDCKDDLILISRHGVGYNNIDLEQAKTHGTIVSIVDAVVEHEAVAENNITNLLALMRETAIASEAVKEGRWKDRANYIGNSLFRKTVGVIGVGSIGSKVVEPLHSGFNCRILGYDVFQSDAAKEVVEFTEI